MEYNRLNLKNGDVFSANHLSHLEDGIFDNTNELNSMLGQIRALQTDNYSMGQKFDEWDDILETLLIPLEFSEEEFAYMFGAHLKETIDADAVDYLFTLAMTGFPLKVIIGGPDGPGSYHFVYDMLYFIPTTREMLPHWSEDGSLFTRLKASFECNYDGMTFYITLEEQMSSEYTIEFSYKVNRENTSADIGMVEYTGLFTMGNTLTADDIGEEMFDRLNIAIANNTPFYLNKWKALSETEQYMNPLKFELNTVKTDENKNPIYYDFINTVMTTNDEGKLVVGAHTLRYDVINQTLTGGVVTNS